MHLRRHQLVVRVARLAVRLSERGLERVDGLGLKHGQRDDGGRACGVWTGSGWGRAGGARRGRWEGAGKCSAATRQQASGLWVEKKVAVEVAVRRVYYYSVINIVLVSKEKYATNRT
jgi:hypothetical protein